MAQIRISAKDLGALALPGFCPRCFWIKMHCTKLPFQIFPGIFASIDSYTKKITSTYFVLHNQVPTWLKKLGDLGTPVKAPHHSKFQVADQETDIVLSGMADEIFKREDGSYFIVDYKTAKFTEAQDSLLPLYEVQLNAYAYIGKRLGFDPVSGIALVYMEPQTNLMPDKLDSVIHDDGFLMGFHGHVLPLKLDVEQMIPPLFEKVRLIYDLESAPSGNEKCENCKLLNELVGIVFGKPPKG